MNSSSKDKGTDIQFSNSMLDKKIKFAMTWSIMLAFCLYAFESLCLVIITVIHHWCVTRTTCNWFVVIISSAICQLSFMQILISLEDQVRIVYLFATFKLCQYIIFNWHGKLNVKHTKLHYSHMLIVQEWLTFQLEIGNSNDIW